MMDEAKRSERTWPGVGLIVTGAANIVFSLLLWVSQLLQLVQGGPAQTYASDAERAGAMTARVLILLGSVLSLLLAPLLIYGGIQMTKGQGGRIPRMAAIAAIVPLTSCCCLLGVPAGAWALVVLNRTSDTPPVLPAR